MRRRRAAPYSMNKKQIVLTGGGTAGHATPHLALIPRLRQMGYEIHYIGTADGIERQVIALQQDVTYHSISSGKLRRYFDWKNFTDPFRVIAGFFQALAILGKIRPAVCFSKGGFVAVPVVMACWLRGIPVIAHESDLTPGLANRISAVFAKKVATTFPECARALGSKGVLTGTPLRPELFLGDRHRGLRMAGLNGSRPILLMMGGSQGAQSVNKALRQALPQVLQEMDVFHLCGKGNLDASLQGLTGYYQTEFLSNDLPDAMACADLVLTRAGANALCEFQALKKPMLLIPLPRSASRGDQILNAHSYESRGLARVLYQEDLTSENLVAALMKLLQDAPDLTAALETAPAADGTDAILQLIVEHQR